MKLCLMILSVLWYMFNGIEHTATLSNFLTFITGSSSRLLRIKIYAAITLYWFPMHHFRYKEFNTLVIWILNQNIAIFTIVANSSHNMIIGVTYNINSDIWTYNCSSKLTGGGSRLS